MTAGESVVAASASILAASAGGGQSAAILTAFTAPLQVTATDVYGNPVGNANVSFFAPASGASATLSSSTATTNASGVASVTVTANGSAGTYSVTASSGAASPASFRLTNSQAASTIAWPVPAAITYGTALTSTQLDAVLSVLGTCAYSPAAGTVLSAGTQTLTATCTPADAADYATATASVSLTENNASLSVSADSKSMAYGSAVPALTGTLIGVVNNDGITAAYVTTATPASLPGSYSITATLSDPNARLANYTVTNTPGTLTVTQAALTVTAANATRTYGAANPVFTGTASGAENGDTFTVSGATPATPASPPGSYAITPVVSGVNLVNYSVTTFNGTLTVTQARPVVSLSQSANPIYATASVTFTASVPASGSGTVPTGTVSFYDGSTLLGAGSLSVGVATFTTSSLATGTHAVTATYSGDTNYAHASSPATAEVVTGVFTFGVASGGSTAASASPGGQAVFTLVATPPSGSTFPAPVTFSVSGLLPGTTATFSPSAIPSGAGVTNVTLTVSLPASVSSIPKRNASPFGYYPIALGLILIPFTSLRGLGKSSRLISGLILAAGGAALALALSACGGSPNHETTSQTQPQSYALTATATSGGVSSNTTLTLTVE